MNKYYESGKAIVNAQYVDRKSIPYYSTYNLFTGSPNASILLAQLFYWWRINERKPFYKFKQPCEHKAYKDGDSWTEELGFTEYQFDGALKRIGVKITSGDDKSDVCEKALVVYWTDRDRMTWYQVNEDLYYTSIGIAYEDSSRLANKEKSGYSNQEKSGYPITETTTEITTNINTNTRTHPQTEEIPQENKVESFTDADFKIPDPIPHRTSEDVIRGVEKATEKFLENAGKAPWLKWYPGKVYSRGDIEKENLQHVGWLFEQVTGMAPNSPAEWSRWRKIHEIWYRESQFDFDLLENVLDEKCKGKYKTYDPQKITTAITAAVGEDRKHEQEGGIRVVIPGKSSPGLSWQ